MALASGPRTGVLGRGLEEPRQIRQTTGLGNHTSVPSTGQPLLEQPATAPHPVVLVVSPAGSSTQLDYDPLPLCMPSVR
eukprot:1112660-Rhodomonas_salina.1